MSAMIKAARAQADAMDDFTMSEDGCKSLQGELLRDMAARIEELEKVLTVIKECRETWDENGDVIPVDVMADVYAALEKAGVQ